MQSFQFDHSSKMYGNSERIIFAIFLIAKFCHGTTNQLNGIYTADRGQFTYQVSVRPEPTYHQCVGVLISDRWTVTSAYCLSMYSFHTKGVRLFFGTYDLREGYSYMSDYIKVHDHFDQTNYEYDVALIRTDRPIIFNEFVQPIPYFKGDGTQNGGQCASNSDDIVAIGWGQDSQFTSQYLLYMSMMVYTNAGCKALWKNEYWPKLNAITVGCASFNGNSTADSRFCNSEMALPLVTLESRVLIGIQAGDRYYNCDSSGKPILFTRISTLADWIFKITNIDGVTSF